MKRKYFLALAKSIITKKKILLFLNGFLLASLLYFYMEDSYERQVFKVLANQVNEAASFPHTTDSILVHSLHLTHYLGERRIQIFGHEKINSLKSFIHPVTFDLQTTQGACGSYSYILSRLLKEFNIETRIAQMTVDGNHAGHMVVEARSANEWVVLDPTYDLSFTKADGNLASFKDVEANWKNYEQQLPANYDMRYNYAGVRYTNWNKIPVLSPMLKQVLYLTIGKEKTEGFSLRTLFLRKYNLLFNVTLTIYLLLIFIKLRKYSRTLHKNGIRPFWIIPRQNTVPDSAV